VWLLSECCHNALTCCAIGLDKKILLHHIGFCCCCCCYYCGCWLLVVLPLVVWCLVVLLIAHTHYGCKSFVRVILRSQLGSNIYEATKSVRQVQSLNAENFLFPGLYKSKI